MEYFDNNNIDGFSSGSYFGFQGGMTNNGSSSLLLDNERGELVRGVVQPGVLQQKPSNEEKAMIALRNHSEAERRRRERINGHLATLRSLIPGTNKMDKATLLAEVVNRVKELAHNAASAINGVLVPTDVDEVKVEQEETFHDGTSFYIRAYICCDFKHQLLSDLKETLEALPLKIVKAEIATIGSRMVTVLVISKSNEDSNIEGQGKGGQVLMDSVHQALQSMLDKFYASEEFTSTNAVSGKRRRGSFFGPSNSSSMGDIW